MKKAVKKIILHPLFSGSVIMIVGSNSVNAINYLYHLVIGRMLGPSAYGELATLLSLVGLLGVIPSAINLVIIKYISALKDEDQLVFLINWLKVWVIRASILFATLILIISPLVSAFLKIDNQLYLLFIAISFPFSITALLNRSILQGLLRFKEMTVTLIAESSIRFILSVLLVYLGFQVGGTIFSLTIATMVGWYYTNLYLRYPKNKNTMIPREIKSMALYALPVLVNTIAMTSLYSSDLILVKHFFSAHEAGLYASLSTLGKIIFFGSGPIGSVMFPLISQRHSRGLGYNRIFFFSIVATSIISIIALIFYWLFPQTVIGILYGSAYLESSNLLVWFGIFMTLFTYISLYINFNLSIGRMKVVLLPLIAAISQVLFIWFYHRSLFDIVHISIYVSALLLASLLIYSSYVNKSRLSNRAGL